MADAEKKEMNANDRRAQRLAQRVRLPRQVRRFGEQTWMKMH